MASCAPLKAMRKNREKRGPPDPKLTREGDWRMVLRKTKLKSEIPAKEDSNHERNRSKNSPNLQAQRGRAGSEPPGHHRVVECAACGQIGRASCRERV